MQLVKADNDCLLKVILSLKADLDDLPLVVGTANTGL